MSQSFLTRPLTLDQAVWGGIILAALLGGSVLVLVKSVVC